MNASAPPEKVAFLRDIYSLSITMIKKQPFGKTGHQSTIALFGAAALGEVTQNDADRTLEVLFEYGINHIDTAASYGDSELRIGPWMKQHRKDFFLATKTEQRTYEKAKESIHRSLDRLQTDHIDLIQMHYLIDPEEWNTAFGPDGALKALIEAKEQGLVRFIGVTGHDWMVAKMHLKSLEQYDFDSVLLPYQYPMIRRPEYARDFEELYQVCQDRNIAVQTIKSIAQGPWSDDKQTRSTWYKPLEDQAAIDQAVSFTLSRENLFLNTVGDINLLPKVLDAVSRYSSVPTTEAMEKLYEKEDMAPIFA